MIQNVELDTSPIQPGEKRPLRVFSDSQVKVAILCYFSNPPPPGYRPCPEAGEYLVNSGDVIDIQAATTPVNQDKYLDINILDSSGDHREFRLRVLSRSGGAQRVTAVAGI